MDHSQKNSIDQFKKTDAAGAAEQDAVLEIDSLKMKRFMQEVRDNQNLSMGLVGGLAAAALGAAVWAVITALTEYQIGWMAIGVGFLVGISVRKLGAGVDKSFGVVGAGCALIGCLAGNLFTLFIVISNTENIPLAEVISLFDWDSVLEIIVESFNPMDALFYGLAIYYGYKNSFRQISPEEMKKLVRTA